MPRWWKKAAKCGIVPDERAKTGEVRRIPRAVPAGRGGKYGERTSDGVDNQKKQRWTAVLLTVSKIIPIGIIIGLIIFCLLNRDRLSVDSLLHYTPENLWLAALVLLAFYAVKSLSVFFPLLVLYVGTGMLFPAPLAVLVNLIGLTVSVSLPYGIGRFAGRDLVDRLQRRYKKIARLSEIQQDSEFFFAFFLRVIQCLPGDVVSMVLGASGMTYWKYLLGSLLGMVPAMVATTIAGTSISDPTSPVFLSMVGIVVLLSLGSVVLWRIVLRKKRAAGKR